MSLAGESGSRAQQMRDKVRELNERAEHTSDPQERQKLRDKARRVQEQAVQEGNGRRAGESPHRRHPGSEKDAYPPAGSERGGHLPS
ncbi:DUF6381 family protein [Streptomyces sp. H27-D2]|uniref:DUF6381 family protein n=1 Tax=Streptomyces sp. H27-D2 TaxID=3046304 RepID=UPI002DBDD74A|nr:DUF6381 family protein [Streptomyces sp. H27-D2]MEC4021111.1 DUF6381 family protein [Streptomyces sp. H27-D2]